MCSHSLFAQEEEQKSPLTMLGDEYQNSIMLLSNRFRIDHEVDEVTMIFFRKYGSSPIVLVRPDGSKIFQTKADGKLVKWFDTETFDLITLREPMPGPWQAVGQINPNSRVMVMSDIEFHAENLPSILFSGEILKQTGNITNGGEPIAQGTFRDVVELVVEMFSTNNPNFDNFGANPQQIARFEDHGQGMDERPMDGIFTGQFNLAVPAGEWEALYRVITPMYTREQVGPPVIIHPNPVLLDVEMYGGGEDYHKLLIDVNRELVDIKSLLIDGKVRFPNGDVENFSITRVSEQPREYLLTAFASGMFKVKITAYGKTAGGRDFILDVPEYSFFGKSSYDAQLEKELGIGDSAQEVMEEETENAAESAELAEAYESEILDESESEELVVEEKEPLPVGLIVGVNLGILLLGAIVIVFVLYKQGRLSFAPKLKLPAKKPSED